MTYSVVIHDAEEGGYWAEIPALDGCYAQGESVEDTIDAMKAAGEARIEFLIEEGIEIPADLALQVATVTIATPSAA
jgi:predicted RNase H-like HicB family nuclease